MIDITNIVPIGYIEASFLGQEGQEFWIKIEETYEILCFALYDNSGNWKKVKQPSFSSILVEEEWNVDIEYRICAIYKENGKVKASFLRNSQLEILNSSKEEFYDKRSLFGKTITFSNGKTILPFYKENGIVAFVGCERKEFLFTKQIKNEILYESVADNENGIQECQIYTKCKKILGNYIGIVTEDILNRKNFWEFCIPYKTYEEEENNCYMKFSIPMEQQKKWYIVWNYQQEYYIAPLCKKNIPNYADITEIKYIDSKGMEFSIVYDTDRYGTYVKTRLVHQVEEWEEKTDIEIKEQKVIDKSGQCILSYFINTKDVFSTFGSWKIQILTQKEKQYWLDVMIGEKQLCKELYDRIDTKYKLSFKKQKELFVISRVLGHNALFGKNIQGRSATSIEDFLRHHILSPKGNMYAEYSNRNGTLYVTLYQQMKDVLEAKLVMYHSQGMGILSSQNVTISNGMINEFPVEVPEIDADNKFQKPINSVWFRLVLVIRTNDGIYVSSLIQYDLETTIEQEGNLYDSRKLYLEPIGDTSICNVIMTALPYYSSNKYLSMKYVRPEQIYRSQFTNELLDVTIKKDILVVKMRCRDCGGIYKGVLMEYRKVKEEDTESYFIPYDSLKQEKDGYIMTTKIDMKQYYMRMLYWDIRCAFELDGTMYTVSCHSNNEKFLKKYKNIVVDRTYPSTNSILFPYATGNNSVALMHREVCPQDNWQFRLKEKVAQFIYKWFKSYWDKKNIYLIFEKYCTMAQDNGYYFFKYCMDANVEAEFDGEIYYVLDKNASDWEKIIPYQNHVIPYLSLKHMIYLQACKLMISTDTKGHAYVWRSMGSDIKTLTYQKKLVFLQHGVTAFKRGHFEKGTNVGCECFITTSSFEHDIIHNYLGYSEEEIPITGFARWDVLHDKSEGHREILVMPTWRTWLDDAEHEVFAESNYCKNYMALLNDPRLDEILKRYDVTLNFYLHPKFRKFITEFSVISEKIRLIPFGEEPLNELMMECNLLITDFSSVAWDVYYMNKPVLFYHFDIEEESKTLGFYMDMKHDIFGDRAETPEELMKLIIEYIENGFVMKEKYKKDREKYFAYVDDNNSERIWRAIQERQW